eukprot:677696-Pyramimonas_sp.AAC.1
MGMTRRIKATQAMNSCFVLPSAPPRVPSGAKSQHGVPATLISPASNLQLTPCTRQWQCPLVTDRALP